MIKLKIGHALIFVFLLVLFLFTFIKINFTGVNMTRHFGEIFA